MNEQLIKLIELCLVDGVISDKERQVIYNKAESLGVSKDECEVILDSYEYNQKASIKETHVEIKQRDFNPKKVVSIPPAPLNMKKNIQIQLNELADLKSKEKTDAQYLVDKFNQTNELRIKEVENIKNFIEKAENEILELNKNELFKCFNTLTKNVAKKFKNVYIINDTNKRKLTDYRELYLKEDKEIKNYISNAKWEAAKYWGILKFVGVSCFIAIGFISISVFIGVEYNFFLLIFLLISLIVLGISFLGSSVVKIHNYIKVTVREFIDNYDFSVFNDIIKNNEKLLELKEVTKNENNIETLSNTIKKL